MSLQRNPKLRPTTEMHWVEVLNERLAAEGERHRSVVLDLGTRAAVRCVDGEGHLGHRRIDGPTVRAIGEAPIRQVVMWGPTDGPYVGVLTHGGEGHTIMQNGERALPVFPVHADDLRHLAQLVGEHQPWQSPGGPVSAAMRPRHM